MPIPPALAAELAALTASLDDPALDIASTVEALSRDLGMAVPSYVGLSVEMRSSGQVADFTVIATGAALSSARASLRLMALPAVGDDGAAQIAIVMYAATAGALVDLAADIGWLMGEATRITLDEDLPPAGPLTRSNTLSGLSTVNQAIGVMIGRGHTIDSARQELLRLAAMAGTTVGAAAAIIVASLD